MMYKILFYFIFIIAAQTRLLGQQKVRTYPYTWTTTTNPIAKHIYACDPSAKTFSDGTIWVFASHDPDDSKGYYRMKDYHFFSTKDLKTWTDHGVALSINDISWATSHLWAPDVCERNGKYYLYAPANHKIGVFISDKPEGPYKDALDKPLVPFTESIDPMVFVDDDGQAYLYFSRRGRYCYVVKLKENMIELDGPIIELTNQSLRNTTEGDFQFVEGPFVHKRHDLYYLSYPAKRYKHGADSRNHTGDEVICYATSNNPLGPFRYQGVISYESGVHTIHQSIIEYEGDDYFFYHNGALAEQNGHEYAKFRRSMCVNKLTYNEDGTIQLLNHKTNIKE